MSHFTKLWSVEFEILCMKGEQKDDSSVHCGKNAASIKHLAKLLVSVLPRGIPTETLLSQAVNREEGCEKTEGKEGQQPESETQRCYIRKHTFLYIFLLLKQSNKLLLLQLVLTYLIIYEKKARNHENIFGEFQNGR